MTPDTRQVGGADFQWRFSPRGQLLTGSDLALGRAWGAKAISTAGSRGLSMELILVFQLEPRESQVLKERAQDWCCLPEHGRVTWAAAPSHPYPGSVSTGALVRVLRG